MIFVLLAFEIHAQEPCNYIYVTPTGNSTLGTKANPSSLTQAITEVNASVGSRKYIRMQNGSYVYGNVVLPGQIELLQDNITIEGGFNSNWEKTGVSTTQITLFPPLETASVLGVQVGHIIGIKISGRNNISLNSLQIQLSNAHIGTNTNRRGHSVYGVYAHNSPNLNLLKVTIGTPAATNGGAAPASANGTAGGTGVCGTVGDCDWARAEGWGGAGGTGGGNAGSAAGGAIGTEWDNSGVACVNGIMGGTGANGTNVRMGGNGGGGGSGSRRGLNGGRGGCGGNGANGATSAPVCNLTAGSGGTENCVNDNCNVAGDRGRTGANGNNGAAGAGFNPAIQGGTGTFNQFYVPLLGANGADGAGGSGAQGGGGGAGEPNFFDGCGTGGCSADDGSGAGGGGGGGGGQGGAGGAGGGAGGSSFCLYTSGTTTYTINQCVLIPGSAGSGTTGAAGGAGGLGGVGGKGARVTDLFSGRPTSPACNVDTLYVGACASDGCSNGETGAGGAGGRGGNGGAGGDGQGGTNGVSRGHQDVTAGVVNSSSSIPPFPADVAINNNRGCTNSEIGFTKTTAGTWGLGSGGNLSPDISTGTPSYTTGQNTIVVYYTTTGSKTIQVNAQSNLNMIQINTPRTLPTINSLPASVCVNSSFTLGTPATGTNYLWEIQATPVVSSTNPTAVYTSNLQNPGNVSLSNAGTYQIRLKVFDDCCGWSIPVYATIVVDPAVGNPTVPVGTLTRCQGNGLDTYTSSALNATSYSWTVSGNNNSVSGTTGTGSVTWDGAFSGTSQVCVSANGCGGPTLPVCVNVTVTPTVGTPSIPSGITTRCMGAAIDTFTTLASNATSYTWTVTNPNTILGTGTDGEVTWDANYSGIAQVCVTANGCGTGGPVCLPVTVNPSVSGPSVPQGNYTLCQGAVGELYTTSAAGATSYTWSISGMGNSISGTGQTGTLDLDPNFTGAAQLCVSANGCGGPTPQICTTLTVTPSVGTPSIPSGTTNRCIGAGTDTYTTNATNATGYTWSISPPSAGTISNGGIVTWNPSFSGQATVSVNASGCNGPSATSSTQITVNGAVQNPAPPVGTLLRCQGVGSDVYVTSSLNATSFTWSVSPVNAGTISGTTNSESINWNPGFSGSASVCVIANGCGISNQICTTVTVNPLPVVPTIQASGPLVFCDGNSVTLTSSSPNNNLWSPGNQTGLSINVTQSGTYTVTVSDNNQCSSTSSPVTVVVNPSPPEPLITVLGDLTLCPGESVTLVSSSNANNSWSNGASTTSITLTQGGVYTVTVTDNQMCMATSDPVIVQQSLISGTIAGPDTVCYGDEITLTASGGNAYSWNTGETTPSITFDVQGNFTHTVLINDALGCQVLATKQVTILPLPVAGNDNASLFKNEAVSIPVYLNDAGGYTFTVLNGPQNGMVYWSGDTLFYTPDFEFFGTDSLYYLYCDVLCPEGCDTAKVVIEVKNYLPFFVPSGISPNGDGLNDYLVIDGMEQYPDNELVILNRWGDIVYRVSPYANDWAGEPNAGLNPGGEILPDGTYFYVFKSPSKNFVAKGYIEIHH